MTDSAWKGGSEPQAHGFHVAPRGEFKRAGISFHSTHGQTPCSVSSFVSNQGVTGTEVSRSNRQMLIVFAARCHARCYAQGPCRSMYPNNAIPNQLDPRWLRASTFWNTVVPPNAQYDNLQHRPGTVACLEFRPTSHEASWPPQPSSVAAKGRIEGIRVRLLALPNWPGNTCALSPLCSARRNLHMCVPCGPVAACRRVAGQR